MSPFPDFLGAFQNASGLSLYSAHSTGNVRFLYNDLRLWWRVFQTKRTVVLQTVARKFRRAVNSAIDRKIKRKRISKMFYVHRWGNQGRRWFAVCSAENGQKNNGHTIQTDCVTVFISVVLPTLFASTSYWRCSRMAACAALRRAIGTRKGEQET